MIISEVYNYKNGYVFLMINIYGIPESINIDGLKLILKSEFHITLINVEATSKFINIENAKSIETEILEEFKKFIIEKPLDQYSLFKKFRFVSRDNRKTIIAMANVSNLIDFFDLIGNKYNKTIPYQPTHATLYGLLGKRSIGLLSNQELKRDSKKIVISELEDLKFNRHHK